MLERYKWLNAATEKIRFGPDRKAVQRELEDHLEDAKERRVAAGLPEDEAEAAALKAMGDPSAIAEELGRLHKPWLGYLWRVSQVLLLAAIGLCCVMLVIQAQQSASGLPGMKLKDYLTWEPARQTEGSDARALPAGMSVKTGGYTIRVDRAVLLPYTIQAEQTASQLTEAEELRWDLKLDLHIDTGWRGEELYWGPNTVTEVRDSVGTAYDGDSPDHLCYFGSSESVWGLGQKVSLVLELVPEDAEWVELDIGWGSLTRTLHIDLTEEAGT